MKLKKVYIESAQQHIEQHSEKILKYYSCIGGCFVAQNTVAEIWSNAW